MTTVATDGEDVVDDVIGPLLWDKFISSFSINGSIIGLLSDQSMIIHYYREFFPFRYNIKSNFSHQFSTFKLKRPVHTKAIISKLPDL